MLINHLGLLQQPIHLLQPKCLDNIAVALALIHLLIRLLAPRNHLAEQVLGVAPAVLDLDRELHVLCDDGLPLRFPLVRTAFCVRAEAGGVFLGFGGDHGAVDGEFLHQGERFRAARHVSVHDARDPRLAADVADHLQLAPDCALTRAHGCGAAVHCEACYACLDQPFHQLPCILRVVENADLDADADLVGLADLLDQAREDVDEQIGGLEQRGAHAARRREGLRTPRVHVDACDVGGDHFRSLHGQLRVRGAHLVDQPALLELRVDAVEHRLAVLGVEVRVLEFRRGEARPFERVGVRVEAARGADDGAVDGLGACGRQCRARGHGVFTTHPIPGLRRTSAQAAARAARRSAPWAQAPRSRGSRRHSSGSGRVRARRRPWLVLSCGEEFVA